MVQSLRDNQQPVCHCTGKAGVCVTRLMGVRNEVVFLETVLGLGCMCTLPSWFLWISSKLFSIILEAYMGIVSVLLNTREICLEGGPSYFSKC